DFGDEGAVFGEVLDGEVDGGFDEAHGAQVVGLFVADGVGGHVGKDEGGGAAERFDQQRGGLVGHEVHFEQGDAGERVAGEEVDADHGRAAALHAHDLAPAAGGDAEVDDARGGFEQRELFVELDQLVGGAAAV